MSRSERFVPVGNQSQQARIPGGWRDVASALDGPLARCPDAEALVDRDRRYSYAQLDAEVNAAAQALQRLGLKPGERLAACSANQADLVIAFLASQRLGAVWLGINTILAPPEKLYQLADAQACVLLADRRTAAQIEPLREQLPGLSHIVDFEPGEAENQWRGLVAACRAAARPAIAIDPHAAAVIAYTSGTTGRPKGVVHSQHNMMVVVAAGQHGTRGKHWQGSHRIGSYLPLTMVNLMVLDALVGVSTGGTSVVMDRTDAKGVAEWIEAEQVHAMSSSPATIFDLIQRDDIGPERLASLRFISCGGAMISDELMAGFAAKFGKPMYPAYGLTEAPTSIAGFMSDKACAPGSCGIVYDHLRVAVLDGEGREVPLGEPGEICLRATDHGEWAGVYTPMLGYWRRPEESAESLRGGWLHTGDVATMDDAGNLFLKDRLKDMIIRGGSNVYPAEIERVIRLDPRVRDAAVVGRSDERLGERVVAFVELVEAASGQVVEPDLKARCQAELAKYKLPDEWIFLSPMPRNATGKIVKSELKLLL